MVQLLVAGLRRRRALQPLARRALRAAPRHRRDLRLLPPVDGYLGLVRPARIARTLTHTIDVRAMQQRFSPCKADARHRPRPLLCFTAPVTVTGHLVYQVESAGRERGWSEELH